MGKIKTLVFSMLFLLGGMSCFAKQLSIQVIQHDGLKEDVSDSSFIVEDEVMNGLFDKGYIVTNSPASVSNSNAEDEKIFKTGMKEASEGYSDYYVQISLFYTGSEEVNPMTTGLIKVEWSVFSVKSGKRIKTNTFKNLNKLKKEEELKSVSYDLIAELYKVVK